MYEDYFNFSGKPFRLSPDPRFYFASRGHERAMAYLQYGISEGEGFIVITGDIGTGKTTLVEALVNDLQDRHLQVIRVNNTGLDDNEILRMVAAELGIAFEGVSKAGLLRGIERLLGRMAGQGRRVLLLIDEVQNLSISALEELRMLSNFQSISEPYLQTFLLGQKEFAATLRSPQLEQLSQRVIASYHLGALEMGEVRPYIEHRLGLVGWQGDPDFTEDLFVAVYAQTGGIPRRINTLVDRLLLFGFLEEVHAFDAALLEHVVEELDCEVARPLRASEQGQQTKVPGDDLQIYIQMQERIVALEKRLDGLEDALTLEHARLRALTMRSGGEA